MKTRLRYKKNGNELTTTVTSRDNNNYDVLLDTSSLSYKITKQNDWIITSQGVSTTLAKLKSKVKNELQTLGVQFNNEVRRKKDLKINGILLYGEPGTGDASINNLESSNLFSRWSEGDEE